MNGIGSVACGGVNAYSTDKLGRYERNEKEFGPVAATVMGAGDAAGQAASALCSISEQGLSALSGSLKGACEGTCQATGELGCEVMSTLHYVEQKASSAASVVSDAVCSVASEVGDAVGTASDYVGSAVLAGVNAVDAFI